MTASMNAQGTRYATTVETNGYRVEMITNEKMEKHLMSLIEKSLRQGQHHLHDPGPPKFLAIIASQRHHLRFFPQSDGVKDNSVLPGTLSRSESISHTSMNSTSNDAVKGTARPINYNALLHEPQ
ncbi:hypothetical protein KCU78_g2157, partial [Aureobasidium melanogenum]